MSETDLVVERVLDAPRELVWEAYTNPEHLKKWWCPKPWSTPECEMDVRPGGKFFTRMEGPNGEGFAGTGCFLEVVEGERIVWTSALGEGWRPNAADPAGFVFTAVVTLADAGEGRTRYRVVAMHPDAAAAGRHETMGFKDGWGTAADQLGEVAAALKDRPRAG
ncbi:MAG: SRPBCC family protein [Alphaproteobacteria bacterium]|nr:SRPBCC family protein [Alphaproteobacteria bacterium]MBV9370433.1 SRPBCC family protein [Alphaproteobacteria bacterium]MBV9900827.1 SRPBCC family protein [Alphaproteobacteria bacterium]